MTNQTYRILAVDDLLDNLLLLQALLEAEGFVVDVATSGRLALNKIKTLPPDLILLDIMMPGMNGYEVTQQIRQDDKLPSIPILLVSACDEQDAIEGLELGANDYIRKPLNFEELLAKISRFLHLEQSVDTDPMVLPSININKRI
jgi:DNA-binding response OmpR family regulator